METRFLTSFLGAGNGATTKEILQSVEDKFVSYTYTDASPAFFSRAQERFRNYSNKMEYRTLDLETDFIKQGFKEHGFDLIIASNAIHGTKALEATLSRLRQLLRPGGYLLLLEITDNSPIRHGVLMCGLPSWWVGCGDGRESAPTISTVQWDNVLRKSGFSGVDVVTPANNTLPYPMSVILTQGVDERVNFLREPLFYPDPDSRFQESSRELLLVGGTSLRTSKLIRNLSLVLSTWFTKVTSVESLEALDELKGIIPPDLILLGDLDQPTFQSIKERRFNGLKSLVKAARNILWLTYGSQGEEPYNSMSIGFGRSLIHERPDMQLQFVIVDDPNHIDALYVAESLLRLCAVTNWTQSGQMNQLNWTSEPEIYLRGRTEYIPRIVQDKQLNARYNTRQRTVIDQVDPSLRPVQLKLDGASYVLSETSHGESKLDITSDSVKVGIQMSTMAAINIPSIGPTFIAVGLVEGTSEAVVIPARSISSMLRVSRKHLVACKPSGLANYKLLETVVWEILAKGLLDGITHSDTMLLYQPPEAFLSILQHNAQNKKVRIIEIVHSQVRRANQVHIHSRTMAYHLKELLPKASLFADFSVDGGPGNFTQRLQECFAPSCKIVNPDSMFYTMFDTVWSTGADLDKMHSALEAATNAAIDMLSMVPATSSASNVSRQSMILAPPEECLGQEPASAIRRIVDWTACHDISVQIRPATAHVTFRGDRSYLLVGLTADLGQSLCEWMISRGARVIVLVSRNPRIEQTWLDVQQRKGAEVHVYSA